MAVVILSATSIFNRYQVPQKTTNSAIAGSFNWTHKFTFEITNGNSIGSKLRLARIPLNAVVQEIIIFNDAITSAAADFGLYAGIDGDIGAVVDVDFFASAVSIATAQTTGVNVAFEARDIADIEKSIATGLALTEAQKKGQEYDVVATLTAAATASGTLSGFVKFTE